LKGIDGVLVENDASISTGSAGSAVFVIGRDVFLIWGNSRLELNPTLDRTGNKTKFPNSVLDQEQYFQSLPVKSIH
jgi:hypothetical protein